ncbi:desmethyl-deoxy-podophyllotoxin synthase-like [Hordeum vulgare subsp. vulgare]|uniref:desmethyl-deoxy-podophyllotoxin synthase-like n=1 Tax=Hordeum vulgare subsp. vulgare TaxID=112509 RepID=UPI001B849DA0|nr:desmethyl-deoxy-podophyllotoxin synthase-like [Hordeum vulgare subsp. vulgare]
MMHGAKHWPGPRAQMEDAYVVVYLGIALLPLLIVLACRRSWGVRGDGGRGLLLPPGPWQLPVIGSLHHLVLAGQLPHRAMRDLARRHGPAMLLRLGEVPTVVVSSREGAREVMKTHDKSFAMRPVSATMRVLTNGGRDIVFAPYGDYWRQLRKIAVVELFTARRVRSFRAVREEEVAAALRGVGEAAAAARPVEMRGLLAALVADSTVRAVIGDRCRERDALLRELDRSMQLAAGFNPADLWPSWRLAARLSGAKECHDTVHGILDGIVKEHLERTDGGEDLLDVLLRIQKEGGLQFPLDMDAIKSVIMDILGAGSETAATTLEWAMAELVKNPRAMHKATAEVRRAFHAGGTVAEQDLTELAYLRLVIWETLRLHPPIPLLFRECQKSCQVLGYDVPRGTQVLVNAWALGRDERYWHHAPEEFWPERFEGEAAVDLGAVDFVFLPFGAGRRMCPGMAFGVANVELPLASLLFHFDWEWACSAKVDMTEAFGLTARRKDQLLLLPVLRVPLPRACLV